MKWIEIPGWGHFQHYKNPSPAWIKLYRVPTVEGAVCLLDHCAYRALPASAQALLIDLWLLASETGGRVAYEPLTLEFRLRRSRDEIVSAVEKLVNVGLIVVSGQSEQISLLDSRGPLEDKSREALEQRRGEERREEERREEETEGSTQETTGPGNHELMRQTMEDVRARLSGS
jgi:hypothetical protein